MINYRVRNLDAMLEQLRRAGATVDPKIDDTDYGAFYPEVGLLDEAGKIDPWSKR